ncbi:integrase [Mycobacterium sp. E802]|uniref:tyrosine-type recombinase/integrase n=1 Tax=Mycobacterium sp. E802 TaxID=1834152 RepID=UPI0008002DEE|nr:site-specific integrase [Mycobacterium sp. E802]OBG89401.1 integrase [Mycobacterium sp. E802]
MATGKTTTRKTTGGQQRRSWGKIRTLRSGQLQASYVHTDGRRYYAPNTFTAKMDAEGWLSNERKLIELGEWTPPEDRLAAKSVQSITVREYAAKWLSERDLAPKTRHLYGELLDSRILPTLGDEMMRALTPADIRAWWVGLNAEKKTPTRNTHTYQLLRAIFNTARDDKVVTENPCQIKSAAKPPKPRDVQVLTTAELDKVAESLPEHYRVALYVSAWCGVRSGELFELRRKDIHVSGDTTVIKVRRQATRVGNELVIGPPKSDAGIRDVVVPPHVANMLRDHMKARTGRGPESFVFTTTRGLRLSTTAYTKAVKKGLREVGKGDMRIHDLRHVGATWAAIAGATTKELMGRIGHASANMSMRYQHVAEGRDAAIAAAMSQLVT